jgi:hypothetical protein
MLGIARAADAVGRYLGGITFGGGGGYLIVLGGGGGYLTTCMQLHIQSPSTRTAEAQE